MSSLLLIWVFRLRSVYVKLACRSFVSNISYRSLLCRFPRCTSILKRCFLCCSLADAADYNEWKGLKRMEGTMGSLTGLAGKIGSAFGGFLMGVLMSASGYVGGADVQVDSAIMMIRVLASVAPLALMLVVAAILRFYTVDKQMPQIKQDLEARAAATTEAAAE